MRTDQPWSGHYEVWPTVWATATLPSSQSPAGVTWTMRAEKSAPRRGQGTYVALRDPATNDWSLIVCTDGPTDVEVRVAASLKQGPVHVWKSDALAEFVRLQDIQPANGALESALEGASVYTFTTTTGQCKGTHGDPPAAMPFPLPYAEDFHDYRNGETPRYFSDQIGTFVTVQRPDGGMCLQQIVPQRGIQWHRYETPPNTVFGSNGWRDYTVRADLQIVGGSVEVGGRFVRADKLGCGLVLVRNGVWKLRTPDRLLASGKLGGFDPTAWHALKLVLDGPRLAGFVDGQRLAEVQSASPDHGMPYLASTYDPNCFVKVMVVPSRNDGEHR